MSKKGVEKKVKPVSSFFITYWPKNYLEEADPEASITN
jgi:hypothetical protein